MCFHNVSKFFQDSSREAAPMNPSGYKSLLTLEDLLRSTSPVHTSSVLFRNHLVDPLPQWYYELAVGDWPLWMLLAEQGNLGYIDEIMSARRIHQGGVWSGRDSITKLREWLETHDVLDQHLHGKYHDAIEQGKAAFLLESVEGAFAKHIQSDPPRTVGAILDALLEQYMEPDPRLRDRLLGQLYAACFFNAAREKNYTAVRESFVGITFHNRSLLRNRGVWSIAAESFLGADAAGKLRNLTRRLHLP